MSAMFGHTWASQYGSQPTGVAADTWAAALAGLTGEQLAAGLSACIAEGGEFPPSAPRFRAMCLGIPSLAKVKREWEQWHVTPFTRLVHEHLDGWLYRQSPADKADRLLREAYEAAREHVMAGGALPDEPVALIEAAEPEKPQPASPEVARAAIDKIGALLHRSDGIPHDSRAQKDAA